ERFLGRWRCQRLEQRHGRAGVPHPAGPPQPGRGRWRRSDLPTSRARDCTEEQAVSALKQRMYPGRGRERGAILFLALILLLVMTVLILASVRGTALQERMAANLYDRSLAFQAVEAALREAARWVLENPPKPAAGSCDSEGNCCRPDPTEPPGWEDEDVW